MKIKAIIKRPDERFGHVRNINARKRKSKEEKNNESKRVN